MKYNSQRRQKMLILMLLSFTFISYNVFGQGPNAPEAASFEPVDAADMVDMVTGDFSYVIPLLNIPLQEGGYPIALSYHGGIGYDQQASWVGLGWNINPGAINRNVLGYPDDWKNVKIKETEYFKYTSQSIHSSGGWGAWDFAIGYSADSNKTWKGETSVGFSGQNSMLSARIGFSYGNSSGFNAFLGVGGNIKGLGIGVQVGSDKLVGVRIGKSLGSNDFGNTSIGISLSTRSNVSVGVSAGGQSATFSASQKGTMSSWSLGLYGYYLGFKGGLGYSKSTMTINKRSEEFVYGPLYFSEMNYTNGEGQSYDTVIDREHDRDIFMDAYSQKLPQLEKDFVAFEDVYDRQKNDFTFPSYDYYTVNAQGLSGSLKPYLFETGMIVGQGFDVEHSFEPTGSMVNGAYECYGTVPAFLYPSAEALGTPYRSDRILVNYHYPNTNFSFKKKFGNFDNQGNSLNQNIHFYFENQFPTSMKVDPIEFDVFNLANAPENYLSSQYNAITNRAYSSNFVETFTNEQINILKVNNSFLEAKDYDRTMDEGYRPHGIGGYRITAADGKTYHYSRPVYHYEEFYRQLYPKSEHDTEVFSEYGEGNSCFLCADNGEYYHEKRKEEPYATHWLLTAVTGPDYIKNDSNRDYPDEGDYGYWIRFDYGKWTDGYIWRNPYEGYLDLAITKDRTAKEYSWGRKQLVYLNKIVSPTHTALFVKSIRKDNIGKEVGGGLLGFPSHQNDKQVHYISQPTLKLDEIILLRNDDYNEALINSNTQNTDIAAEGTHMVNWTSMNDLAYGINLQSNVLDNGDLLIDAETNNYEIHQKALKIIKFDYSYELGQQSLNSISDESNIEDKGTKGRLTLNEVKTYGKGTYNYMPGYKFDYIGKDIDYSQCLQVEGCEKDPWGYHGEIPSLWSLNKITVPTGGEIHIDYEEDEYWTEAFSRRYWTNGLEFKFSKLSGNLILEIKEDHWNDASLEDFLFTDYFHPEEPVFLDFWFCTHDEDYGGIFEGCETKALRVDIPPNGYIPHIVEDERLVFMFNYYDVVTENSGEGAVLNRSFANNNENFSGTYDFHLMDRGQCRDAPGCWVDKWNLVYKILANRVPGSGTGGGVRVAAISSVNEYLEEYTTKYSYNHPSKNRTTGITSYAPIRAEKYVAYQAELPPPRVMYEYVTVSDVNENSEVISAREYRFNVLSPVLDIFNENMEIDNIFTASVKNNDNVGGGFIDVYNKTSSNEIVIKDNTAMIGNVLESSLMNSKGQIISRKLNEYLSFEELADDSYPDKPGSIQESFFNMKSIHNYFKESIHGNTHTPIYSESIDCIESEGRVLKKRLINSSSKIIYPLVNKQSIEISDNHKLTTIYKDLDQTTGMFLTTETQLSDNSWIKTEIVPAYTKYPEMGSKVDDINNKNMLSQEAMTIVSRNNKTIGASLTTWNDIWDYRDNNGNISQEGGIWRKHKSFVWKDGVYGDGSYVTTVNGTNDYFDWTNGEPEPLISKWQQTSEITKYSHWSTPMEIKDVNGNYASSKMADAYSKIIVDGNAKYTELYYSGAEHVASGNVFEGEVKGAYFRTNDVSHTGDYAVKTEAANDKVFEISGIVGPNEDFSEGTYKVSFWAHQQVGTNEGTQLRINNQPVPVAETVSAGCWKQFNYYLFLPSGMHFTIHVTNILGGDYYFDDFRLHPVAASVNSYVYDQHTDELLYILDANNMGTAYKYDAAGRLKALYNEVEDTEVLEGGFKLVSQYKQHYKNLNTSTSYNADINRCINASYPDLNIKSLSRNCIPEFNAYDIEYKAEITGGSGQYTYEWQWLVDTNNQTFTNWIQGSDTQFVPYAARYCSATKINKHWEVKLKVTDDVTGEVAYSDDQYYIEDCATDIQNPKNLIAVEASKCHGECKDSEYMFHMYPLDGLLDLPSPLSYTDNNSGQSHTIDLENGNGLFCPSIQYVETSACDSGFIAFASITPNYPNSTLISYEFYLNCVSAREVEENSELIAGPSTDPKYARPGIMLVKEDGKIISAHDISKIKK